MRNTVLITGVSGGIGLAAAGLFIREGWQVIGVDAVPPACHPPGLCFIRADLANAAAYGAMIGEVEQVVGHLNALVNNAAVQVCRPLLETGVDEWDVVMAVNLRAAFLCIRHCHPLLCIHGGSVVNIGSVHAVATSPGIAAYAASKGGLVALTRAAALELAGDRIRVNGIHPGAVDTAMLRAGLERVKDGDSFHQLEARHPLGRVGRPEEIAQAVMFLADEKRSSFITGQFLTVDGGALSRLGTE